MRRFALICAFGLAACGNASGDGGELSAASSDASEPTVGGFDSTLKAEAGSAKDAAGSDGPAAGDAAGDATSGGKDADAKPVSDIKPAVADTAAVDAAVADEEGPEPDADPPVCGDGICNPAETWSTCSLDCAAPPSNCGDLVCTPGENVVQCPVDCDPDAVGVVQCLASKCKDLLTTCLAQPACVDALGNGAQCTGNCTSEDCIGTCIGSQDQVPAAKALAKCGYLACSGAEAGTVCGDGTCETGESKATCPADCGGGGSASPKCTDGTCDSSESAKTCPMDCDAKGKAAWQCGKDKCPQETANCQADPKCLQVLLEAGACIEKCGGGDKCADQCKGPVVANSAALSLAICGIQNCPNP